MGLEVKSFGSRCERCSKQVSEMTRMDHENNQKSVFTKEKDLFVKLLTANYSRIYAYIITMVPHDSDADDLMQETATLMWENFDRFELGTNFVSWAVTIAKFQVLKYRKKQKNRSRLLLSDQAYDLLIAETEALQEEKSDRLGALRECLKKLSERDRQFIKMRYSDGATAKVVSQKVGISIDAVYRHGARLNGLLLNCIRRSLA